MAKRPVLEVTFATPFDDTAPTAPADLDGAGERFTASTSSWTAATDNVAVTNYEIYRDGDLLAVTDGTSPATPTAR